MELVDYWGVLRRWSVLIIAGTLVAALIGYRIAVRSREAAHPLYAGAASVAVNYVTPPGVPYIPTLSLHAQTDVLSARVHEPGLLSRVAAQAHIALPQVQRVSTAVDPQKPLITIQVRGTTPRAAAMVAQGLAQYLAGVETQQVQAQAASLSRTVASAVAQAQQRWLAAQTHYYLVCGCLAGQHQAPLSKQPTPQRPPRPPSRQPADPPTLAQLRAELDLLQANYAAAAARYTALQSNPVPVATVMPGSVAVVPAPAASPLKAVLLATVVGLVLCSGLAVLLDHRRSGSPALARAGRPVHAASPLPDPPFAGAKGGSGSARRADAARQGPEPATTRAPGAPGRLRAVLPAAGLGLLACISLGALLINGRTVPLSVASHVDARRVRPEERRRPQTVAQPDSPLAARPAPPALLLNPDAVSFNHHDGPTHRTAHTIYVVNVGPAPVTIRTITITGPDRAAFTAADTCTRSTVGVYSGCTISVRVAPATSGGTRKATLVIMANPPASPQRVPMSA